MRIFGGKFFNIIICRKVAEGVGKKIVYKKMQCRYNQNKKGQDTMKYNIAICDDARKDRELLRGFLGRWAGERGHSLEISEFPSAESFLFSYAQEGNFHILLLDIEMGAMDGVAMAKKLRRDNDMVQIVFVTGYSDYIAEIYGKFNDIVGDKTAIYIRHRLSSCKFCDEITVFHQGQVIQQGSHEELLAEERGKYHELWQAQAQYYAG